MYDKQPEPVPPPKEKFKCECVVVCVNYADFLAHTLPFNKHFFDRMVVVTTPEDKETQKLCEFYHVECHRSAGLRTESGEFRKGVAINAGLSKLSMDSWVLHLDADIWLPPQTRLLLERAGLDKSMVYGCDRFNVKGYEEWRKFLDQPKLQQENDCYIHLEKSGFPVGTRVMQGHMQGYVPIGFFQLWSPTVSGVYHYPENSTDAGHTDLLFSRQWPRDKRGFIPELIAYHLESEDSTFAANWKGRKTAPFKQKESV